MTSIVTGLPTDRPASMAVSSDGHVFVVTGATRGRAVQPNGLISTLIGVPAPQACSAAVTNVPLYNFISAINIKDGGANYRTTPTVTIGGAAAKAELISDFVASIAVVTSATTHVAVPAVSISTTAQASNATASAIVRGPVTAVHVSPRDAYYTTAPDVTFFTATAVTARRTARGRASLTYSSLGATSGKLASIILTDPGEYEWAGTAISDSVAPVAATVNAPIAGLTPTLVVEASAAVVSVTMTTKGSDYSSAPAVSFVSLGPRRAGDGAIAFASLSATTQVQGIELLAGGAGYDGRVETVLTSDPAIAAPTLQPRLAGKYLLAFRWVGYDGTPGNLSPLHEVDCADGASSIVWGQFPWASNDERTDILELWRTSADQAITLYRVQQFDKALIPSPTYADTLPDHMLTDPDRTGYAELPLLTAEGRPNAYRFGIPPSNMSVVTIFQDRAWYAVDSSGLQPNVIYFSGISEFEAIAYDPDIGEYTNQLIIETVGRDPDVITGLMPMSGSLYVGQRKHIVRLTVGDDPLSSASAVPVSQRGMLNDRCWDQFEGTAYIADSQGVHAFNGDSSESLSEAISTYWTTPLIDLSKSRYFFLRVNEAERAVRFYYAPVGSSSRFPTAALCYSLTTKAWWSEDYAVPLASAVRANSGGSVQEFVGGPGKIYRSGAGSTDDGTPIPYSLRTGEMPLNTDPRRGLRLTYKPTATAQTLGVRMYYNNSSQPRPNAVASDRGTGFVCDAGSTQATLNMAATRSPLGTANGFAQLSFSGRIDDRSTGADRTMSIEVAGTASEKIVIHNAQIEGVG